VPVQLPVRLYPERLDPVSDAGAALPRRVDTPGTMLELLVVASDRDSCAGVDLVSGALVRAWSPWPLDPTLRPFDVVSVTLDDDHPDLVPDPYQPEAVVAAGPPSTIGRLTGRRAERYLRRLVHPAGRPLLWIHGPAVPFWERTQDHPSIALVEPEGRALITRRAGVGSGWLTCRFGWRGVEVELPLTDRRVAVAMARSGRRAMGSGKGDRLVVALTPPVDGHCHKVVAGILPRP
jgi:hypothetical protein